MTAIPESALEEVKSFYNEDKLSASKISQNYGVTLRAVYYFLNKHNIMRRTFQEEQKLRFENKPASFKIKEKLTIEDKELKTMGVILYWGEGYKSPKAKGVDFANSDPAMVAAFMSFLRNICGVDELRLRAFLYCYSNQNQRQLIDFWSQITKIPKQQFSKPYARSDFRSDKIDKMKYGLIHIRYFDKKLLLQVKKWIEEYKRKYASVV